MSAIAVCKYISWEVYWFIILFSSSCWFPFTFWSMNNASSHLPTSPLLFKSSVLKIKGVEVGVFFSRDFTVQILDGRIDFYLTKIGAQEGLVGGNESAESETGEHKIN